MDRENKGKSTRFGAFSLVASNLAKITVAFVLWAVTLLNLRARKNFTHFLVLYYPFCVAKLITGGVHDPKTILCNAVISFLGQGNKMLQALVLITPIRMNAQEDYVRF